MLKELLKDFQYHRNFPADLVKPATVLAAAFVLTLTITVTHISLYEVQFAGGQGVVKIIDGSLSLASHEECR